MPIVVEADMEDVVRIHRVLRDVYHHISNSKGTHTEKVQSLLYRLHIEIEAIDELMKRTHSAHSRRGELE